MTLVLFDIDGTLTATSVSDAICYARAFEQVFGIPLPTTDWHEYTHCTDFAIMDEVLEEKRGTPASDEERAAFEDAFVVELEARFQEHPDEFAEVPGAKAILEALEAREDIRCALATGGMRKSALLKLDKAGIAGERMPAGFANDSVTREGIARQAIAEANHETPDVVYVGDGLWDVKTSAALGMRFVGITAQSCQDRLRNAGATRVLEDYSDQDAFWEALEAARVPAFAG